jgi:hypothetical protein
MEEHFLRDFVSGPKGIEPEPWYNSAGDCIICQTTDEPMVAKRVDNVLTVYHSLSTGKTIGYEIKGVKAIINKFGLEGISVECKQREREVIEISLTALLLAAYEQGPQTISRRKAYADAFSSFTRQPAGIEISDSDLALRS